MSRNDITYDLIHFTKGEDIEDAFQQLRKIIKERRLICGGNLIKGGHKCVCFSEAPLASLQSGLVNPDYYSSYSPFGIMFKKKWIFEQGGRPVIYQTNEEYEHLRETHRWRHMRYHPNQNPPVDFTWEREWRVRCDHLDFNPEVATIVVADSNWSSRLMREHERDEEFKILQYSLVLGEEIAHAYHETFKWDIVHLNGT